MQDNRVTRNRVFIPILLKNKLQKVNIFVYYSPLRVKIICFFFLCSPAAVQREVEGKTVHQIMSTTRLPVCFRDALICKEYYPRRLRVRGCVRFITRLLFILFFSTLDCSSNILQIKLNSDYTITGHGVTKGKST